VFIAILGFITIFPNHPLETVMTYILRLFVFDGSSFEGLVPVKRAVLVLAYGASGYAPDGDFAAMNFLEPYLVSLMDFLGIEDTQVIRIEGTTGDAETLSKATNQALNETSKLFIKEG
jgi:FMN-dependent NADH-azoreductase